VAAEENMDNKDKMLIFLRIVGFDGFDLYDHRRISLLRLSIENHIHAINSIGIFTYSA
jgi:hypothetical protein